jgi:iron-sulfur cluster assembly protein
MQETIGVMNSAPETAQELKITEKAAKEILKIKQENNIPESYSLRVGVKGGGCSGFSYVLGFDGEQRPDDHVLQLSGVTVCVDPRSLLFLEGTELDFQDGLMGRGFVFNNPKAAKTCGCGNSFSV